VPSVELKAGNPQVVFIQEASAGSANDFYAGDLVKVDSNGELVIATAGAITGIARRAATGTASTKIPVELISDDNLYVAKYKASATTEALIGDTLDFTFTASAHTLDESSATTDVDCVMLDPRDDVGTSGGKLVVRFKNTAIIGVK
jgi:hypothetical protein